MARTDASLVRRPRIVADMEMHRGTARRLRTATLVRLMADPHPPTAAQLLPTALEALRTVVARRLIVAARLPTAEVLIVAAEHSHTTLVAVEAAVIMLAEEVVDPTVAVAVEAVTPHPAAATAAITNQLIRIGKAARSRAAFLC